MASNLSLNYTRQYRRTKTKKGLVKKDIVMEIF